MPGRSARKKPPLRWDLAAQRFYDELWNALVEMDMRGELADRPPGDTRGKGVIRIQNRWRAGRTPVRRRRHQSPSR
jgi:hypothetical protein